jgi:hypothetical protein
MDIPVGKVVSALNEIADVVEKCGKYRFKLVANDIRANSHYLSERSYQTVYDGMFAERLLKDNMDPNTFTFSVVWAGKTFVFGKNLLEKLETKEIDNPIGYSVKLAYSETMEKWHPFTIRMVSKTILAIPIAMTVRELGETILTRKETFEEYARRIENCAKLVGIEPY